SPDLSRRRSPSLPPPAPAAEEKSLFTLIFNGVGFVALVAVILLAFVIYRNGGIPHDLGGGVRAAFGLASGSALDFPVHVTDSGYYPTLAGEPLVFVAGTVDNDGSIPRRMEVELEVVDRDGKTVARGRGWPGLLPTPDELYAVTSPADLTKLQEQWRQQPAVSVLPRHSERFVIVAPRPAGGAEGCELRVQAHPVAPGQAESPPKAPGPQPTAVTAAVPPAGR
ncbi:MAG TPA: hypothetical protein VMB50_21395, partial [Myxococcales bacterium]|nr:hypothetical protein [Myxococcales bacterium]